MSIVEFRIEKIQSRTYQENTIQLIWITSTLDLVSQKNLQENNRRFKQFFPAWYRATMSFLRPVFVCHGNFRRNEFIRIIFIIYILNKLLNRLQLTVQNNYFIHTIRAFPTVWLFLRLHLSFLFFSSLYRIIPVYAGGTNFFRWRHQI